MKVTAVIEVPDGTPLEGILTMACNGASGARVLSVTASRTYTREEAVAALNAAANMLPEHESESVETIRQDDIINLMVNAAGYLLEHPGASLDEVIIAQYADIEVDARDTDDGEDVPEEGSQRWNELVVARVLGWIAE